jgi:hypothetical protein
MQINFQMAENLDLTAYMCFFLSEHILPFLAQAPPNVSHSSLAASRVMIQPDPFPSLNPMRHLSSISLNQESELNSLNEQIRRYFISTSKASTSQFRSIPLIHHGRIFKPGLMWIN